MRQSFKRLCALPFVPVKDVISAFSEIKKAAPSKFSVMTKYFETWYIGDFKKNSKVLRKIPCYPISMWNVHARVLADDPRTNNSLESWHKILEVFIFYFY